MERGSRVIEIATARSNGPRNDMLRLADRADLQGIFYCKKPQNLVKLAHDPVIQLSGTAQC